MSKQLKIYVLSAFLAIVALPAAAADYGGDYAMSAPVAKPKQAQTYAGVITNKIGSGFSNLLLGWLEIPKNMMNTRNEVNFALGALGGPVKGVLHSMGRVMTGVFDMLTFPIPTEPLTTPQYVWENWTVDTRYNRIQMANTR